MPKKGSSKRYRPSRRYRKRTVTGKGKVSFASSAIRKIVKKEISRSIENKRGAGEVQSLALGTYTATPVSQSQTLVPTLSQGALEYQRIGQVVTVKRVVLRGYIRPKIQADGTFNTAGEKLWNVRMIIGKPRNINSQTLQGVVPLSIGDLNNLFRDGVDNKPFASNNPLSLIRPTNKFYWKICYDRIHRIGISSNGAATSQGLKSDNNNYPINKFFTIDLTKFYKKKLIFDESSSYPQNDCLWMSFHLCDLAGSSTGETNVLDVTWYLDYEYEDA